MPCMNYCSRRREEIKDVSSKAVVIGNGELSLFIAGQLSANEILVTYLDMTENFRIWTALHQHTNLSWSGALQGETNLADVHRFSDIPDENTTTSITNAEIIVITVTASVYPILLPHLAPLLHTGQHVIVFPAIFGAQSLLEHISSLEDPPDVTIAEAASFPAVCTWDSKHALYIQSIKSLLQLSVYPTVRLEKEILFYNAYFNLFEPAVNFLETSLSNINVVLHPLPILLNLGAVERNAEQFRHFLDGFSPLVGALVEQIDRERLAVGKAFGLSLSPALSQLKMYYGDSEASHLYEYVSDPDGPHKDVQGFGVDSRYITEDIPYLLVPMLELGRKAGIPMPISELCLRLAEAVMAVNGV